MQDFDQQKQIYIDKLYKPDRSRKGDVDEHIIPLIDFINSSKDYYTTSSCSGRIYLLIQADKKPDVKWLYVSHEQADAQPILEALRQHALAASCADRVWLRQENMILHIACRDVDHADILLKLARECGFRRSGIIADSNVIIVEICDTEKMDVPVADKSIQLVSEDYIRFLVDVANEKFAKGREKLHKFDQRIRAMLNLSGHNQA